MNSLKYLIRFNASRNFLKPSCPSTFAFYRIKRQLYSPANLKLDSLEYDRSKRLSSDLTNSDFMNKMKNLASSDNDEIIFSSDLLKMLRIVESEEDLSIFLNMLKKYSKQNINFQFSSYQFGPQVMRLFHLLGRPKEALHMAEDENFSKLFSPVSCKIVLFDLLYENQMYDDIVRLFKKNPAKHQASALMIIYFAACWKINTQESYKSALEMYQCAVESNQNLPLIAKCYLALLCLEQNNPAAAYEILAGFSRTIPLNIRIRALAKARRFKDLFHTLDKFINFEKNSAIKNFITSDTISYLTEEMNKAQLKEDDKSKWNNIFEALEQNQLFDIKTLEEEICHYMSRKGVFRKSPQTQQSQVAQ